MSHKNVSQRKKEKETLDIRSENSFHSATNINKKISGQACNREGREKEKLTRARKGTEFPGEGDDGRERCRADKATFPASSSASATFERCKCLLLPPLCKETPARPSRFLPFQPSP